MSTHAIAPGHWEQRFHPLRREWVIVAAHRQNRPWQGETVGQAPAPVAPAHAPDCYLCPGNTRVGGTRNPAYDDVFVFDNDHPCVGAAAPDVSAPPGGFYQVAPARGRARVVCYTPRHDLSLSRLSIAQIVRLMECWQDETRTLGALADVNGVLIFENRGEVVGVSNPHPHGQIYATNFLFRTFEVGLAAGADHLQATGRVLFQDIIAAERADGRRILTENPGALGFVPYFARQAYEVFVAPRETHASIVTLTRDELTYLAGALKRVLVQYDNLWRMPFPYVLVLHQAPTDGQRHPGFHFHIQIHPPLRQPRLLKYLAGPEIGGGNFLSDTCPEDKAAELRATPDAHYLDVGVAP